MPEAENHNPRASELIVLGNQTGWSLAEGVALAEMSCGEDRCPFYRYIGGTQGHPKMLCRLPGLGSNVIDMQPFWRPEFTLTWENNGEHPAAHRRTQACLLAKPPSAEALKAFEEMKGQMKKEEPPPVPAQ